MTNVAVLAKHIQETEVLAKKCQEAAVLAKEIQEAQKSIQDDIDMCTQLARDQSLLTSDKLFEISKKIAEQHERFMVALNELSRFEIAQFKPIVTEK